MLCGRRFVWHGVHASNAGSFSHAKSILFVLHHFAELVTKQLSFEKFGTTIPLYKDAETRLFDKEKTALQCLLDAIMMLTFFDAVVIAIATCSYRDSNMMLST